MTEQVKQRHVVIECWQIDGEHSNCLDTRVWKLHWHYRSSTQCKEGLVC